MTSKDYTPEELAQLKKEIIDGLAGEDPQLRTHLENLPDLPEAAFQTLLRIAMHRAYPEWYPHPGYGQR